MISFRAPDLCQGADESLIIALGDTILPGVLRRAAGENGLRIHLEAARPDEGARALAAEQFQALLGVLRSCQTDAGQLRDELLAGVGQGAIRDQDGNQVVMIGSVLDYAITDEHRRHAKHVARAIPMSPRLWRAFWLNGRTNRTSGDYYMIYELAEAELGGADGISAAVQISKKDQSRFTQSANNLPPAAGGRHAAESGLAPWDLQRQNAFAANLLRGWATHLGGGDTSPS